MGDGVNHVANITEPTKNYVTGFNKTKGLI